MKRFKSARQVQRFLSIHDLIAHLFNLRRDHRPVADYRTARVQAFETWAEVTGIRILAYRSYPAMCRLRHPLRTVNQNKLTVPSHLTPITLYKT